MVSKLNAETTQNQKKILLVDLDETLIYTSDTIPKYPHHKVYVKYSWGEDCHYVAKRPKVNKFFKDAAEKFEIYIYTTSLKQYAEAFIEYLKIKPYIKGVYHREHCKKVTGGNYLKDLTIVEKDLKDVILIDDSENQIASFPDNSLQILAYKGGVEDDELSKITPMLLALAQEEDVRPIGLKIQKYREKIVLQETQSAEKGQ